MNAAISPLGSVSTVVSCAERHPCCLWSVGFDEAMFAYDTHPVFALVSQQVASALKVW
jgi:hypothetical protein